MTVGNPSSTLQEYRKREIRVVLQKPGSDNLKYICNFFSSYNVLKSNNCFKVKLCNLSIYIIYCHFGSLFIWIYYVKSVSSKILQINLIYTLINASQLFQVLTNKLYCSMTFSTEMNTYSAPILLRENKA